MLGFGPLWFACVQVATVSQGETTGPTSRVIRRIDTLRVAATRIFGSRVFKTFTSFTLQAEGFVQCSDCWINL